MPSMVFGAAQKTRYVGTWSCRISSGVSARPIPDQPRRCHRPPNSAKYSGQIVDDAKYSRERILRVLPERGMGDAGSRGGRDVPRPCFGSSAFLSAPTDRPEVFEPCQGNRPAIEPMCCRCGSSPPSRWCRPSLTGASMTHGRGLRTWSALDDLTGASRGLGLPGASMSKLSKKWRVRRFQTIHYSRTRARRHGI